MRSARYWLPVLLVVLAVGALRLGVIHGSPDLLHDLDAGELKQLALARDGLPPGDSLRERLHTYLSGPETIHHGGYPTVSILYAGLQTVLGPSLETLRLIPTLASMLAAACALGWIRRYGAAATTAAAALLLGAPPLLLKWTCVARGGHVEGIALPMLLLVALELARRKERAAYWLSAGAVGGFAVYFTYLAAPAVLVLALGGALTQQGARRRGWAAGLLALGGLLGFLPWLIGLVWLDLPYFDATIHATANPDEAAQVRARGTFAALWGLLAGLPHNLGAWNVTTGLDRAYHSDVPDLLRFAPGPATWASRAVVAGACLLGLLSSLRRGWPLVAAVAALPALHHAFVLRLSNVNGWPDVPHRYLVLVYPAVALAAALGVAEAERWRRPAGALLAALLVLVGASNLLPTLRWTGTGPTDWDVPAYAEFGLGQARMDEAAGLDALLADLRGGDPHNDLLGVGRVFPGIADYYLLFRPGDPRPPPRLTFTEAELPAGDPEQQRDLVRAAARALDVRRDTSPRDLCSAERDADWAAALAEVQAEIGCSTQ